MRRGGGRARGGSSARAETQRCGGQHKLAARGANVLREDLRRGRCGGEAAAAAHARGASGMDSLACGARRAGASHLARKAGQRKKDTTRCAPVPAEWHMRQEGGETRGGCSARAGSQRHGSTSLQRQASRRKSLCARGGQAKKDTTRCAPGPAEWRKASRRQSRCARGGQAKKGHHAVHARACSVVDAARRRRGARQ
jgi:hypothetical protein